MRLSLSQGERRKRKVHRGKGQQISFLHILHCSVNDRCSVFEAKSYCGVFFEAFRIPSFLWTAKENQCIRLYNTGHDLISQASYSLSTAPQFLTGWFFSVTLSFCLFPLWFAPWPAQSFPQAFLRIPLLFSHRCCDFSYLEFWSYCGAEFFGL